MNKIFVIIPSYQDPFLYTTLKEAVSNAKNPDRVIFSIGLQYAEGTLPDLSEFSNDNFKYIHYDVETRPGVNIIRHDLSRQYTDEDYCLLIDSHMHFETDWDEKLIQHYSELQDHHGKKVVWSQPVPSGLNIPMKNTLVTKWILNPEIDIPDEGHIGDTWNFLLYPETYRDDATVTFPEKYMEANYSSAHFFFTTIEFLSEVGINNVAGSYEEEFFIYYAGFLSGWRFFNIEHNNFIAHDAEGYNKIIHGDKINLDNYSSIKRFSRSRDTIAQVMAINLALIFNAGPAKVKNSVMDPSTFYEKFGILKDYEAFKALYVARYDELLKIANQVLDN